MFKPKLSMVLLPESPLLNLDTGSVHLIDTQNTGNLHAFWSVCSRCARTDTLQNAKRLENLTWRIYSQQALTRSVEHRSSKASALSRRDFSSESVPGLSTSPGSPGSLEDEMGTPPDIDLTTGICHIGVMETPTTISPVKLETMVKSVTENNELEPLSPLPTSIALPVSAPPQPEQSNPQTAERVSQPAQEHNGELASSLPKRKDIESSTSTMPTTAANSELFDSNVLTSTETTATDYSTSIVRGFSKEIISRSVRSRTQLAPPQPILKQASPQPRFNPLAKTGKKKTTFMIGASSEGDDDSSWESPQRSSLTQRLQEYDNSYDHSESAIEDDEDAVEEDDWVDEEDQPQEELFQRVESSTNLKSRPSLLTGMLHEQDRAAALQNAASRSTPAIRRSRTSSHNGPLGTSPPKDLAQLSRARQIITSDEGSQAMPIALSPRTNRRNMLQTELTGSLRKHLLWERQQRYPAAKPLKNRGFRSEVGLSNHVSNPNVQEDVLRRNDTTIYDNGLQEYFEKGW